MASNYAAPAEEAPVSPTTINVNTTVSNNGGTSSVSPGRVGTIMSFLTVVLGIVVSIITYVYAPSRIGLDAWTDGCPSSGDFEHSCKSNSAVLRISCALTILFGTQALITRIYTPFYDMLWLVKFGIFVALVIGFFFGKSSDFGTDGYAWVARITGFFFLIIQQIILIDVAYSWNEKWLEYAGGPEGEEKGNFWLVGIVIISIMLLSASYAVIGVMYWQFDGCHDSTVIISLTLCLSVIATLVQLFFSEEGSILTSAIMTAYSTYICYSSVTLNPNVSCNPTLNTGYQTLSTVIGLILAAISLLWTTYNTVKRFPHNADGSAVDVLHINVNNNDKNKPVSATTGTTIATGSGGTYDNPVLTQLFVQLSLIFVFVSGYYAMVLTNWDTEQSDASINNPRTGKVAMWIQAAGQWIAIVFYFWSLVAPKILTNRDFN